MAERGENESEVIMSPSHIQDFFKTKNSVKGSHRIKQPYGNDSSVYLTPESSPSKDQSNVMTADVKCLVLENGEVKSNLPTSIHGCHGNSQAICKQSDVERLTNDHSCHLSHKCICPADNSQPDDNEEDNPEECVQEHIDSDAVEDALAIEGLKQPILSHSPTTEQNKHSRVLHKTASGLNSQESTDTSSPSLPRTKVRRGTRSKKVSSVTTEASDSSQEKPKPVRRKKKEPSQTQSTVITDFFPVRRSSRQSHKEIERQKQELLERLVISKCEDGLEVKLFEGKGRGIVATKDFDKGDFVVEYAGDHIDIADAKEKEKKYSAMPEVGCYMYYFNHAGKNYCVDATAESGRLGRLINHSRDGNCCTRVISLEDGPRLILVAAKNIKAGHELTYDYGDRRKSSLEAHPWLKL